MQPWYYSHDGQQQGPVSFEEIRQLQAAGTLTTLSLVWNAGLTEWTPLGAISPDDLTAAAATPAAAPAAVAAYTAPAQERAHPFEFHGKAGEFFRIWIVNVVLTVLTLGIYAAWAKVRTRRYFYGNTLLDGKPFDFTGNPISILKGNLLFGGLFVIYTVAGSVFPPLAILVMLVILVLSPWLIQKALRFRAHNTVHRNVRLNFRGTTGEAYGVFLGLALLLPFTLGLIMPYLQFRQKKYFLGNLGWGNANADMQGRAGFFYKTFFKSFGLIFILAILASLAVPAFSMMQKQAKQAKETSAVQTEPVPPVVAPAPAATEQDLTIPTDAPKRRDSRPSQLPAGFEIIIIAAVSAFYLLFFLLFLYYQVRTNNYAINTTQWGQLGRLESKVRVRDLIWLFITNGIAVLLSLGLLIPWVKVRMARYHAARTTFIACGSLDAVAQSSGGNVSAMGDAGADIFDFDIGF
ncbi:MAG: DUF898 family protein [Prosthecobacter sp.]|uniref:DUF898 family protein n=1 Tax=Prosthecobacter sp. TaxID=1965333 RepID=UPI003902B9AF